MGVILRPKYLIKCVAVFGTALAIVISFAKSSQSYAYKESAVRAPLKLSARLENLFKQTKILCFGRYALEVPREAQLIIGSAVIRNGVEVLAGGLGKH